MKRTVIRRILFAVVAAGVAVASFESDVVFPGSGESSIRSLDERESAPSTHVGSKKTACPVVRERESAPLALAVLLLPPPDRARLSTLLPGTRLGRAPPRSPRASDAPAA